MAKKRVVLAYSGGLDTSVAIRWIQDHYHCEVIAFIADLGQEEDMDVIEDRARKAGVSAVYIEDLREEFLCGYCFPALRAGAVYEDKYMLATALGRPLICKHLVTVAQREDAFAVAHGCSGKGNDQVRFDVSIRALSPGLDIVAPLREWEFKSRQEEMEYAAREGIPVDVTKKKPYSIDRNIWGVSIECGVLEDPWCTPPGDVYQMTADWKNWPAEPEEVLIGFEKGVPVRLNGKALGSVELVKTLNGVAGKHGVGRVDLVENRLVGIKSREIYECPGATVLFMAAKELASLVYDREMCHFAKVLSHKYAELVYYGWWFSPLRKAIDAFFDSVAKVLTGEVRIKLYKGSCVPEGRKSPESLYDFSLATYDEADIFNHQDGIGFSKLWGLPLEIITKKKEKS